MSYGSRSSEDKRAKDLESGRSFEREEAIDTKGLSMMIMARSNGFATNLK
jgi:hypothetical protein